MKNVIKGEPVAIAGAVTVFGGAVIAILQNQLHWDGTLTGLVSGAWTAFIGMVVATLVRGAVTPTGKVAQLAHDTIVALAPQSPDPVLGAWYTDGEYPLEHLIHLTSVTTEGRWCGDGYRRGIDGTLRLEYLDAKWASNQEMGARWRRTAQPSDFVST